MQAILGAALAESATCSYTNHRRARGSPNEKMIFVNGSALGGNGTCGVAGAPSEPANTRPVADGQTVTTQENTAVEITLTGADADSCEGQSFACTVANVPTP